MNEGKKILVVDDDILVQKSVQKVLQKAGYSYCIAKSASEAIDRVKKEDFNNLFLFDDIHSFEEISKKAIEYKPDFIFIDFIQSINHI